MIQPRLLAKPITLDRKLTIEDLKKLQLPMEIQDNNITFTETNRGHKLRQPVTVKLDKLLSAKETGLIKYITTAFLSNQPKTLPFIFDNQTIIKLAQHFLRNCSGSHESCIVYTVQVQKYAGWLGYSPDEILADIKPTEDNDPDPKQVKNHTEYLKSYLAYLQDKGLAPGAVSNYIKAVKTFYRVNGVKIDFSAPRGKQVTYKDRAPKPEELAKLLAVADLRERVIVSLLAHGGFREGTLTKLQYRHVKQDLEAGIIPLHIHIEADITKGKYHDYDTFLGVEAVSYLKLYMEQRRRGTRYTPPEIITDSSPLLRDEGRAEPKDITSKQIRFIMHKLYVKAGLATKSLGRFYDLRTHSVRKYFKTQMISLGAPSDYVDYFMGHTIDTYHDIQNVGIDKLRNVYAATGLAIQPKTKVSQLETIKEMMRSFGMNPEQMLTREALMQGAITEKQDIEEHQLGYLRGQLKQLIKEEIQ
jgi:site-specific recombinase XerD